MVHGYIFIYITYYSIKIVMSVVEILLTILLFWTGLYTISRLISLENIFSWVRVGPFYLMIKSERLNRFLGGFSKSRKKVLQRILDAASISGIIIVGVAIYLLSISLTRYFEVGGGVQTVQLIIPGVTISMDTLLRMLPALTIIIVSHELAHKIGLHTEGVRIKSMGVILLFLIPGAFVEPDEESFQKSRPLSRMRILSAGTFINMLIGLMFLPIVVNPGVFYTVISPLYAPPSGVIVTTIVPNTSLAMQNYINIGDVIIGINNHEITDLTSLYKVNLRPGENATVTYIDTDDGSIHTVVIRASPDPYNSSRGILGFIPSNYYPPRLGFMDPSLPNILYEVFFWIYFLGVNIAIFNMLPIYGLDGYGYIESLLEYVRVPQNYRRIITGALFLLAIFLLALNLLVSYILR